MMIGLHRCHGGQVDPRSSIESTTLFMVYSLTYYSELRNALIIY